MPSLTVIVSRASVTKKRLKKEEVKGERLGEKILLIWHHII